MGMMEHPVTHSREINLEIAKHWIDVLGMLETKTRNNLLAQEEKILEGLLADLRMQYVSMTGSASASASRPLTGRDIVGGIKSESQSPTSQVAKSGQSRPS